MTIVIYHYALAYTLIR